jgi:hypothetical protein
MDDGDPMVSQSSDESDWREAQTDVMRLVESGNFLAAISYLEAGKDAVTVSANYIRFAQSLYKERKDVSRMLDAARRGIAYSVDAAARNELEVTAARLKENAKTIAFNAAANCWPGWGDDVIIEPTHLIEAVDLAGQCLRLVEELKLGNIRLGRAYWLIGALALARGLGGDADEAFEHAQSAFHAEGAHASELMVQGYRALSRMHQPRSQDLGAVEFGVVRQRLQEDGSKEALFYLQQLTTADRLLWPSTPATA